ncbi:MAG: TetR/AcrR family transcriptional regulator [Clostridium sp.]|jgi:AcrR family transcriptional regulator|nr:TetR/AcrR family transcriptional regulator [Clostridium sp.]
MGKISGAEREEDLPEKVLLMYRAVMELLAEGADMNTIKVSAVTERAGIGKGTAYDYFDSKEEIIASAIAFQVKKITEEIFHGLKELDCFDRQAAYLLEQVAERLPKQDYFIRFVHMMTDTSSISRLFRERMEKETARKYRLDSVLRSVMEQAVRKGEIRGDLPVNYLVYALCARLIIYMLHIHTGGKTRDGLESGEFRALLHQGIMEEFSGK